MVRRFLTPGAMILALPLAACGAPTADDTAEAPVATDTTDQGVVRDEAPAAEATPAAAAPAAAAIQTQPGPDGSQVALNKVAVTGDILTIQLSFSGGKGTSFVPVERISVVDDATSKQLGVLKDNSDKWLAAPLNFNGSALHLNLRDTPTIVWFKTPAPAAGGQTVSINIPEVAPFDGVPVTR
ncbi:hypothetical protein ACBY01_14695 [Sphingomonas sp. ac-8]|uniref:hypothetical protein n=1 Tax=Sphingomonas sp. ac-8 TaxID=3242977 RepID=UPI003A813AA3